MKKYDEREVLFARVGLKKGSKEYKDFYNKNRAAKKDDDRQRGISFRNNVRKSDRFKELFFPLTKDNKYFIKSIFDMAESKPVNPNRVDINLEFSSNLKEIAKYYGATSAGITKLNDYSFYSTHGGLSEALNMDTYNNKILPKYKTAIVFTVLMDKEQINRGPQYEELLATEEAYVKVATVGSRITMYLKELGYKAMFNNSEFYLGPLVPLAHDAGLGQIGMCNHIVTKEYGNNVRLGAVFTNLEVNYDKPIDFGLTEFCKRCALCLSNCPSKAITHLPRYVNGRQFYKFHDNRCYDMWLKSGTDCGTCISTCPLTQGVDLDKLDSIKDKPEVINEILDDFVEKNGRRVYTKADLDIVKMESNNDEDN
ncbi:3-chloro-4-hydroxyphenylacetate reductive dehalogenase precursor [Candidatus Izimaplasma bacterium HR1]|jgi:epoxyqueuosine reductase QueG|uniref:4Fe-4S dicluster domain-containing protein n=1 Tax=Candidatus Izimoplasma sp. HR1 TaxID=1541959 RepID=UPI0004F613F7|nr:3-chloro-4-hydroxyphenylacetate reductive dehalogenase precursor [Candidatus Izimaplasma bacterium HR1]